MPLAPQVVQANVPYGTKYAQVNEAAMVSSTAYSLLSVSPGPAEHHRA